MTVRTRSIALLVVLAGCTPAGLAPVDGTPLPALTFDGLPVDMDAVDCDALLSEEEIADTIGETYTAAGRRASSCYWVSPDGALVQLVFQTGDTVPRWRGEVLRTYTKAVGATGDVELWSEPGDDSIAVFGPERGLIMHGVGDRDAVVELLWLALARL